MLIPLNASSICSAAGPGLLCASPVSKRAGVHGAWTRLWLCWGDQCDRAGVPAPGDRRWKTRMGLGQAGETFRRILRGRNELVREQVEKDRVTGRCGEAVGSKGFLQRCWSIRLSTSWLSWCSRETERGVKSRRQTGFPAGEPGFLGMDGECGGPGRQGPGSPLKPVRLRKRKMPNEERCSFSCPRDTAGFADGRGIGSEGSFWAPIRRMGGSHPLSRRR